MLYLGCHLSSTSGYLNMVNTARSIGANTFAYFTRNPRGSKAKELDLLDCMSAVERLRQNEFGKIVAHGSYTMNLCTLSKDAREFAGQILEDDLRRMASIPGQYYNFPPGSHVGQGIEIAIEQIPDALRKAMVHGYPVTVLLETLLLLKVVNLFIKKVYYTNLTNSIQLLTKYILMVKDILFWVTTETTKNLHKKKTSD